MDLNKASEELRREKEILEPAIASLEEMQVVAAAVPEQKRRGRKSVSPEECREISARMRQYWAARLAGKAGQ
jgi:hypothetical protein